MSILKFYMNPEKENEMLVKLFMHEGEEKTDRSYKWGQYALHLSIQLNFNTTEHNPFAEDQGCNIHFLSNKIIKDNDLDSYGYIKENEWEEYLDDDIDFEDFEDEPYFGEHTESFFEPDRIEEAMSALEFDENYVNILLDQNKAMQVVGGLLTMTATSGTAIHEALKESAKRISENKDLV